MKMFSALSVLSLALSLSNAAPAAADGLNFEPGVPADVKTKVQSDLQLVSVLQASQKSPMHAAIYGAVDGSVYSRWFSDRVTSFGYDPQGLGVAVAYNDSNQGRQKNHMMVTDYFVKGDQPQTARIMVLFHEARHSEANHGYWTHILCPNPYLDSKGKELTSIFSGVSLAGQPGCDQGTQGAYGSSSVMLTNIARFCTNCTDKVKQDAALYGDDQVNRLPDLADRAAMRLDATRVAK